MNAAMFHSKVVSSKIHKLLILFEVLIVATSLSLVPSLHLCVWCTHVLSYPSQTGGATICCHN